jgi:hypothetical protein
LTPPLHHVKGKPVFEPKNDRLDARGIHAWKQGFATWDDHETREWGRRRSN